jgi:glutathione S-transferase
MVEQFKLTYYKSQGLGECIRYLFVLKGIPFEDVHVPEADEMGLFLRPEFHETEPYHQVPMLETEGKELKQSTAILRFLGRKFNLCGKDEFEFSKCDQHLEATRDFVQYFIPVYLEKDEVKKAAMLKDHEMTISGYMGIVNDYLTENGGIYLVGNSWTIADIYFVHIVTILSQVFKLPFCAEFPSLKNLCDNFFAIPTIAEWIKNRNY